MLRLYVAFLYLLIMSFKGSRNLKDASLQKFKRFFLLKSIIYSGNYSKYIEI